MGLSGVGYFEGHSWSEMRLRDGALNVKPSVLGCVG